MGAMISSCEDMERLALDWGFLPFFKNEIPGFSIEERTPPELWFSDDKDGPWDWKGPVARRKNCVYGKLFRGRAGFVSLEWLPDLVNLRRDGYDFDARFDEGLTPRRDKLVYETVAEQGSLLTYELKRLCGYGQDGLKGFDGTITRLQMQTYLVIADFEHRLDRHGRPYGWGVARYATPEALLGGIVTSAYSRDPAESAERIRARLTRLLPTADPAAIERLIQG